jgi:hypothetical protein
LKWFPTAEPEIEGGGGVCHELSSSGDYLSPAFELRSNEYLIKVRQHWRKGSFRGRRWQFWTNHNRTHTIEGTVTGTKGKVQFEECVPAGECITDVVLDEEQRLVDIVCEPIPESDAAAAEELAHDNTHQWPGAAQTRRALADKPKIQPPNRERDST